LTLALEVTAAVANDLTGTAGNDTLDGAAGRDTLRGLTGDDVLFGGQGSDVLNGADGNDTIYAADGFDVIYGGRGSDLIDGGAGKDTIYGGTGNDTVTGGSGADTFVLVQNLSQVSRFAGFTLTDFTSGEDQIDLAILGLTYVGTAGFSGAGNEVRFREAANQLQIDLDGDRQFDMRVNLQVGAAFDAATDLLL
jgi:Ca2+-binding RTX toxin-like protein